MELNGRGKGGPGMRGIADGEGTEEADEGPGGYRGEDMEGSGGVSGERKGSKKGRVVWSFRWSRVVFFLLVWHHWTPLDS